MRFWRVRVLVGTVALLTLGLGCDDGGDGAPDGSIAVDGGGRDTTVDGPAGPPADKPDTAADTATEGVADGPASESGPSVPLRAKVDLLFMVDNSGSMMEEQANLARNFPLFMQALEAMSAPSGPDLHIAVVSSDLGAGAGTYVTSCLAGGNRGVFCRAGLPPGVDFCERCGVNTSQGRFLRTRDPNFAGSISTVFSCMAQLGTSGCGFEHSLGSLTSALTAPENGAFLRDDAYLALVIITDEDDCTGPADSTLFANEIPSQDISLRCSVEGHTCNGKHNDGMTDVDLPLAQCQTASDGALRPVAALVNDVLAVKRDPNRIIAAGIFGWPLPSEAFTSRYQFATVGVNRGQRPVCQSTNGAAAPGLRVKSFVESFPNHTVTSICQNDFRPALQEIADRIRAAAGM